LPPRKQEGSQQANKLTETTIRIYRIADGKIVENWDDVGLQKDFEQFFPSESAQ
jgi:predicted SnoaL-like aldol condensation-catalyzing enzyme